MMPQVSRTITLRLKMTIATKLRRNYFEHPRDENDTQRGLSQCNQERSDGGYIGIYTPKISNRFVHVRDITTCFEIAMTS